MNPVEYSLIIPVYNSASTLPELLSRIEMALPKYNYELILIDDCSRDSSWEVMNSLQKDSLKKLTQIRLSKNRGQHSAILCGLNYTSGQFIITLDDDLQHAPENIPDLIAKMESSNADLVYGTYREKNHSLVRNLGSWCIQFVFRKVFSCQGQITSFRLFKSSVAQKIIAHQPGYVFIDGLLHWYTSQIDRIEVPHYPRKSGQSGYNMIKLIKLSSSLLFNYSTLPLRFISISGFSISLLSFIIGIIFIIRKFMLDVPIGFTAVIVSIFFTAGVLILMLGIVSEYLSRIYNQQNHKPLFTIDKIIKHE